VRQNIPSGSPWEPVVGYSRAVRVGNQIFVSGTTATDSQGEVVGRGDPYSQSLFSLKKIASALESAGGSYRDVVRTRMYVVNISDWEAIGRAHHDFFSEVLPATTMVEVSRLIAPELLVEIEADAVVTD